MQKPPTFVGLSLPSLSTIWLDQHVSERSCQNFNIRMEVSQIFQFKTLNRLSLSQNAYQGWISYSNLRPILEICALRPSFLHKFTLIWHHVFGPCAPLIAFCLRFGWALRFAPCAKLFMKSTPSLFDYSRHPKPGPPGFPMVISRTLFGFGFQIPFEIRSEFFLASLDRFGMNKIFFDTFL
jgi:hypothetical protein